MCKRSCLKEVLFRQECSDSSLGLLCLTPCPWVCLFCFFFLLSLFLPLVFRINHAVSHHDPENTFNCSFIEPPTEAEPHSPTWSDQESFSSFETSEDGPVYCIPHEGDSQWDSSVLRDNSCCFFFLRKKKKLGIGA